MKEEDKLLQQIGKKNPFQVPDNYFDNFTKEVMQKLPEKEKVMMKPEELTLWDKVKPWVYMAAVFIGAALIIRVASTDAPTDMDSDTIAAEEVEMEYLTDMLEDSMLDDYSLYVYLTADDEE